MAQLVKKLPAMRETWVQSLGWEDPLEKGKATHSSILAWRIPWTTVHGLAKSQTLSLSPYMWSLMCPSNIYMALVIFFFNSCDLNISSEEHFCIRESHKI